MQRAWSGNSARKKLLPEEAITVITIALVVMTAVWVKWFTLGWKLPRKYT